MFDKGKVAYRTDIKLGERYRDDQTGVEGVAVSVGFFQHACERVTLERVSDFDRKIEEYTFDAPRLTHVTTGLTARATKTGGPLMPPARRPNPAR